MGGAKGEPMYIGTAYMAAYSDFRLVPKVMHGDGMADMAALLAL